MSAHRSLLVSVTAIFIWFVGDEGDRLNSCIYAGPCMYMASKISNTKQTFEVGYYFQTLNYAEIWNDVEIL